MKQYKDTPYFVTEDGKVFGVRKHELKLNANSSGYLTIRSNKLNKSFSVHRMIAECYIPNTDNKPHVNHIDGNRLNNHISNLEWVTRSENMKHSVYVLNKGIRRKISEKDIEYIRKYYKPKCRKFGAIPLGNKFGVSFSAILYHIKNI